MLIISISRINMNEQLGHNIIKNMRRIMSSVKFIVDMINQMYNQFSLMF